MSFDRLIAKIIEKQNPSVAGLDLKLSIFLPSFGRRRTAGAAKRRRGAAEAILAYNKGPDRRAEPPIVPAVKPPVRLL